MKPYRSIRGREHDGTHATPYYTRYDAAMNRRERAQRGRCINGTRHGKATKGIRCAWCWAVYKLGLPAVLKLDDRGEAPPRPPGYRLQEWRLPT